MLSFMKESMNEVELNLFNNKIKLTMEPETAAMRNNIYNFN